GRINSLTGFSAKNPPYPTLNRKPNLHCKGTRSQPAGATERRYCPASPGQDHSIQVSSAKSVATQEDITASLAQTLARGPCYRISRQPPALERDRHYLPGPAPHLSFSRHGRLNWCLSLLLPDAE